MDCFYEELKEFAGREGISVFGVCRIDKIVGFIHPSIKGAVDGMGYGISLGYRLSDSVLSGIEREPNLIYKHHYKTVNWLLDQSAEKLANLIQIKGNRSLAIPSSQTVDWERQEGHFSHILVANESGLGWVGKSRLLVNPKYGARIRYATVLTDLPMGEHMGSPLPDGCGDCGNCIEACPSGAITENRYDKYKCLEQLKKFAGIRGIGVYICGICVKVCSPITGNRKPK